MKTVKKFWPHIIFTLVIIGIIFSIYKDYGIAWDEEEFWGVGRYFLVKILNFFNIKTSLVADFYPAPIHLAGHGVLFDLITAAITTFNRPFTYANFHLVKALMAVPIFILVALTVYQASNIRASFIAMVVLLLFPRFFGDIFNNAIDISSTFAVALALCYFIYYLKSNRSVWKQIILGLICAIAISQRIVLGYLLILDLLILLLDEVSRKRVFIYFFQALNICMGTVFFVHLLHPYVFQHPIKGLWEMVIASKSYYWYAGVLFEGVLINSNQLPWYYLLKSMLITIPLATIFFFVYGIFYAAGICLKKSNNYYRRNIYLFLLLSFIAPAMLVSILRPTLYDSWRHLLFLTVPIVIFTSIGVEKILIINNKFVKVLLLVLIVFNYTATAYKMIRLHPYQYVYYNELIGGLKGAYRQYETDYWGLAYKEAVEWFNKNVASEGKKVNVIVQGDPLSSSYYFNKNILMTNNYSVADYCIFFTRWNLDKICEGETVYTVEREGVPLVFIKKNHLKGIPLFYPQ